MLPKVIISYCIAGTVGAGSCLYAHIYIHYTQHNKLYNHTKNNFYFWFPRIVLKTYTKHCGETKTYVIVY